MSLVLLLKEDYRIGYTVLLVSAVLALATLAVAQMYFPKPSALEAGPSAATAKGFTASYWLYMCGGAFVAAGLVSFELISFHFSKTDSVTREWIPLLFALAMAVDGISGLIFGRLFDKVGMPVVYLAIFLSSLFAPLVFFGTFTLAVVGMVLWGIGFGAQDSLFKSIIAGMLPEGRRNLAFGLYYTGYGTGWLVGSVTTGFLYEWSLPFLVGFSVAIQLISLPVFFVATKIRSV